MPPVLLSALLLLSALAPAVFASPPSLAVTHWEQLPLPPLPRPLDYYSETSVYDLGLEPGGTPWVVVPYGVFWWDGHQFRRPERLTLQSDSSRTRLIGGPDRGLFVAMPGDNGRQVQICSLEDGGAWQVSVCPHGESHVGVSSTGLFYNWGEDFIVARIKGEWNTYPARLSDQFTDVHDLGKVVYFYCEGRLYSVTETGEFTVRELVGIPPRPASGRGTRSALWGPGRLLVRDYTEKGIWAFDLATGAPLEAEAVPAALRDLAVMDLLSAADGSAWVLAGDPHGRGDALYRLTPEGEVQPVSDSWNLRYDMTGGLIPPGTVVSERGGSVWFAPPVGGLAQVREGSLSFSGWRQGVPFDVARALLQDERGTKYALTPHAVYAERPGPGEDALAAERALWQEYNLAGPRPMLDSKGYVWAFLQDHPGQASRWDGEAWQHFPVPFDTRRVWHSISDDRGHLLLQVGDYGDGTYDLSAQGCTHYRDTHAVILAAAQAGVRRFVADPTFQGCVRTAEGQLWYGLWAYRYASRYDGSRWEMVKYQPGMLHLWDSPRYGVLFSTGYGDVYTFRGDEAVPLPTVRDHRRWLLGPEGVRPCEEAWERSHPGVYMPVERMTDERGGYPRFFLGRDELPLRIRGAFPGRAGGYWITAVDFEPGIYRAFGNRVLPLDLARGPLAGRFAQVQSVMEDRRGNLWLWDAERRKLWNMQNRLAVTVTAPGGGVGRTLALTPQASGEVAHWWWRLDGGAWQGGEAGPGVTVQFPGSGRYRVDVLGMGPLGETSLVRSLTVRARVATAAASAP